MQKIKYIAFGNHSGYSQAAQDMIFALDQSGKYDVGVEFLHESTLRKSGMSKSRSDYLDRLKNKKIGSECVQIYHCIPTFQRHVKKSAKNIGFATFETFDPPSEGKQNWVQILKRNDAVIAPSKFNFNSFSKEGLESNLFYIPHVCDGSIFHKDVEPLYDYDEFTFLFLGSWRARKGYQALLEAWLQEFSPKDNVRLLIKTDKTQTAQRYVEKLKRDLGKNKDHAPVSFETDVLNEDNVPRLIRSVDCVVLPTLGEGFGLPGLQSMFCHVPLIVTNHSGCKDYANEDTAFLLEPEGWIMHPCLDSLPQFKNKKWPVLTSDQVASRMRYVLENPDVAKQKADTAYDFARSNFSYRTVVDKFDNLINTIV